jgi:hypothetical protein
LKTVKQIVKEASKDSQIRDMLRSADNTLVNNVKDRFYGIVDNMDSFVGALNSLNGETGEFSKDLIAAKKMKKEFDKITLGKYL